MIHCCYDTYHTCALQVLYQEDKSVVLFTRLLYFLRNKIPTFLIYCSDPPKICPTPPPLACCPVPFLPCGCMLFFTFRHIRCRCSPRAAYVLPWRHLADCWFPPPVPYLSGVWSSGSYSCHRINPFVDLRSCSNCRRPLPLLLWCIAAYVRAGIFKPPPARTSFP